VRHLEPQGVEQQHEDGRDAQQQEANHPGEGSKVAHDAKVEQTSAFSPQTAP
jgi:hypothetical protein